MIIPLLVGAGAVYMIMKAKAASVTPSPTVGGSSGSPAGPQPPVPKPPTPSPKIIPTGPDMRPSKPIGPIFGYPGYYRMIGDANNPLMNSGGGGPENLGAKPDTDVTVKLPATQPGWWYETDDEYYGAATKSTVPVTAGGGLGQPADAFRWLGDNFGARQ